MTREEFVAALKERRRVWMRRRRVYAIAWLLSVATYMGLWLEVKRHVFVPLPAAVAEYLLKVPFWRFSASELARAIRAAEAAPSMFPLLLSIYWLFHVAFVMWALFLPVVIVKVPGAPHLFAHETNLLDLRALVDGLRTLGSASWRGRKRLLRLALRTRAFLAPIPIHHDWYSHPEYQWLNPNLIDGKARAVFIALQRTDSALSQALDRKLDSATFVRPLQHLENYYFLVAARASPTWLGVEPQHDHAQRQQGPREELHELTSFARAVTPVLVAVARATRTPGDRGASLLFRVYRLLDQPLVRQAALLTGVAAVIMLIGTLLFKIRADQAFLTWFTVAFGGFTISVGITTIRSARHEKSDRESGKAA